LNLSDVGTASGGNRRAMRPSRKKYVKSEAKPEAVGPVETMKIRYTHEDKNKLESRSNQEYNSLLIKYNVCPIHAEPIQYKDTCALLRLLSCS